MAFSLCKVGESITFSGLTVIGALATVVVATFGLYQGLGPGPGHRHRRGPAGQPDPAARPAGRARPQRVLAPDPHASAGTRAGPGAASPAKVVGRPVLTLVIGLVIFGGLAAVDAGLRPQRLQRPAPAGHLRLGPGPGPPGRRLPVGRDRSDHRAVRAAGLGVERTRPCWPRPNGAWSASGQFSAVTGALDPDGATVTPAALAEAHAAAGLRARPAAPAGQPTGRGRPCPPPPTGAYQASAQFISADGRTIQFETVAAAGPSDSTAAAAAMPAVRAAVGRVARSIGATASGVNGDAAAGRRRRHHLRQRPAPDHPHRDDRAGPAAGHRPAQPGGAALPGGQRGPLLPGLARAWPYWSSWSSAARTGSISSSPSSCSSSSWPWARTTTSWS